MNESTPNTAAAAPRAASQQPIDLKAMWNKLWAKRKLFFWALPITFVVSAILIMCVPKTYECTIILAPEAQNTNSSLGSLISGLGFNFGSDLSNDAISSTIYPDLVKSPDFIITLFDIPVQTKDGEFSGTFYDYLCDCTVAPFWKNAIGGICSVLFFWANKSNDDNPNVSSDGVNTLWLDETQWGTIRCLQKDITCVIDKKTKVVKVTLQAQDPLVCATVVQAIAQQIQQVTTDYRTQKAQVDVAYYEKLIAQAKEDYEAASEEYITYADSHEGLNLQLYKVTAKNLQGEMELKYTSFTTLQRQLIAAQAKLQENTPVFTTIQSARVPLRAIKPHRSTFVLGMCLLVFCVLTVWVLREDLMKLL